MPDSVLDLDNI